MSSSGEEEFGISQKVVDQQLMDPNHCRRVPQLTPNHRRQPENINYLLHFHQTVPVYRDSFSARLEQRRPTAIMNSLEPFNPNMPDLLAIEEQYGKNTFYDQAVPGLTSRSSYNVGGNPPPRNVRRHEFFRPDPSTQDQLNQTEEITSQGDSKRVLIPTLGRVTRTTLRNDLLTNRFEDIFTLQHPNLLTNFFFLHSDEANVNLHKFKAIISGNVSLAFEYAHLDNTVLERQYWAADLVQAVMFLHSRNTVHGCIELSRIFLHAGILKLHLIPYQLIPRTRNFNYTADEVRCGQIPTKKSDVYSTAAVEYFILEGQEPPLDKSGLHFTTVSPEAKKILVRAGSVNPKDRPSAQDMFDALYVPRPSL